MAPATAFHPYCKMAPPHRRQAPLSAPTHCPSQSALTPPGQKWEENRERAAEPRRGWEAGLPPRGGWVPSPPGAAPGGAPRLLPSQPPCPQGRVTLSLRAPPALPAAGPCSLPGANGPLKRFQPRPHLSGELLALPAQSSSREAGSPGRGAASDRGRASPPWFSPEIGVLRASAM